MNHISTLLIALLLGAARASAAGSAGGEPLDFLNLDADARAVALGGAYTALATDANALLYNPGALGRIDRNVATFMHSSYFTGVRQQYAAFASRNGWGVNFNYLTTGDIRYASLSDPNGTGLGSNTLNDLAVGAGYGRAVGGGLSLGAGLKYVRENVADARGHAFAADLGSFYEVAGIRGLTFGAAILNIGPALKYQSASENLPLNIRGGAGYVFDAAGLRNTASIDVSKGRGGDAAASAGLETIVNNALPLRIGFTTKNSAGMGFTAGVGLNLDGFSFAYAFVPFGELGDAHRASVTWRWGPAQKAAALSYNRPTSP
jgi:hypothetical protein